MLYNTKKVSISGVCVCVRVTQLCFEVTAECYLPQAVAEARLTKGSPVQTKLFEKY